MQSGQCFLAISSIMSAVMASPFSGALEYSEETPARNPLARWSRIGVRRSSSRRGKALAAAY